MRRRGGCVGAATIELSAGSSQVCIGSPLHSPCIERPASVHCALAQAFGAHCVAQMHLGHSSTGLPPAWVNTALQRDLIARHFVSSRSHSSSSLCCVSTSTSSLKSFLHITDFSSLNPRHYILFNCLHLTRWESASKEVVRLLSTLFEKQSPRIPTSGSCRWIWKTPSIV